MSGGHWGYKQFEIQRSGLFISHLMSFAAAAEHELDYRVEGDSCLSCARLRVGAALEALFDAFFGDGEMSTVDAVLTNRSFPETQCSVHRPIPQFTAEKLASPSENEETWPQMSACPLCTHPFLSGDYAWEQFGLIFHRSCLMRLRRFGLHLETGRKHIEGRVIAI